MFLKSHAWFFPCLALLSACAFNPPAPQEGKYASGKDHFSIEVDSAGQKHGREIWWYENGNRKYLAANRHGRRDGIYQGWYASGVPWYRGRDSAGVPMDTLFFWYSNGKPRTVSVFRGGRPVQLTAYDSVDFAAVKRAREDSLQQRRGDSLAALENTREAGIGEWSKRVRMTVEPNWELPRELLQAGRRAVANIRVRRDGTIVAVAWIEKSESRTFNSMAERALRKSRKLPPFPASVNDASLDLQYEFVTPGVAPPRRKLRLRAPAEMVPFDPRDSAWLADTLGEAASVPDSARAAKPIAPF